MRIELEEHHYAFLSKGILDGRNYIQEEIINPLGLASWVNCYFEDIHPKIFNDLTKKLIENGKHISKN